VIAGACVLVGLAIVAIALLALPRSGSSAATAPSASLSTNAATTATIAAAAPRDNARTTRKATGHAASTKASSEDPLGNARRAWEEAFARNDIAHVPAAWVAGYYDVYARAQNTFGINWLLLASIHRQETAFSTASSTYHGLNFANCCAGPMQFNVTNGPTTTWERYRHAYKLAKRPVDYPHRTKKHPSVYDDYDAIMAAGSLLRDSGAAAPLDGTAWQAAYDYYGHDQVGVEYADQVVARAIGWSQDGFRINEGIDPKLIEAVHLAWGAPVLRQYAADEARKRAAAKRKREEQRKKAAAPEQAVSKTTADDAVTPETTTTTTTTTTTSGTP
jgi:hypothetical protein